MEKKQSSGDEEADFILRELIDGKKQGRRS